MTMIDELLHYCLSLALTLSQLMRFSTLEPAKLDVSSLVYHLRLPAAIIIRNIATSPAKTLANRGAKLLSYDLYYMTRCIMIQEDINSCVVKLFFYSFYTGSFEFGEDRLETWFEAYYKHSTNLNKYWLVFLLLIYPN